jgi:glycine oxidase
VKSWDAIVVGAGIIGLSLSFELRKRGLSVLILDKGEPGREASWAAGGMLANCGDETPAALKPLADASAAMYPEFVAELQDASGINVDLRSDGTLLFPGPNVDASELSGARQLPDALSKVEPGLAAEGRTAVFLEERSVCPRALVQAAAAAVRHRGVDIRHGEHVLEVAVESGRAAGVRTAKTTYAGSVILNCAGAWASEIARCAAPTRPVKGQMVCFAAKPNLLRHVVRSPEIYLIPRSDGRLLAGATVEDAGFDKRVVSETIQRLERAAMAMLPPLQEARVLEAWAGLRPGSPDNLPILGGTATPGCYIATGHYRDGILLAPVTATVITQLVCGEIPSYDLTLFTLARFAPQPA